MTRRPTRSRALSTLAALAAVGATRRAATAADAIRLASIPIDGGAQCWYADEQGFFRQQGLAARIESISNGGAITSAVIGGALNIGYSASLTVAQAYERGVPVTVIAPGGLYMSRAPISGLLVPVDSAAKSAKDLNGMTVAVNGLKNITELATRAWCDANGGDSKTLNFVEMSFSEMPAALGAHRVAAAFVTEPLLSAAVHDGKSRLIGKPYDAIASNFTISVWFAMRDWAQANPTVVRRFATAIRNASVWANSHDSQSAAILAQVSHLPLAVIEGMTRSRFPESVSPKDLQPTIDVAARYGLLPKSFPAAEIIDPNAV